MPRITCEEVDGRSVVEVNQKHHSFRYVKPAEKDLQREGRMLEISTPTAFGSNTIRLNGTQIRTLKKIFQEAGELS